MKTCKRRVVVYIDVSPIDTNDSQVNGTTWLVTDGYKPDVYEGNIRNRVEIEVTVPVRNEVVDCGSVKAEAEGA